jgi:hypothetical protein
MLTAPWPQPRIRQVDRSSHKVILIYKRMGHNRNPGEPEHLGSER